MMQAPRPTHEQRRRRDEAAGHQPGAGCGQAQGVAEACAAFQEQRQTQTQTSLAWEIRLGQLLRDGLLCEQLPCPLPH